MSGINETNATYVNETNDAKLASDFNNSLNVSQPVGTTVSSPSNDLFASNYPDSSNIINERYKKYAKLVKAIQQYIESYLEVSSLSRREFDHLKNKINTNMPNFESLNETTSTTNELGEPSGTASIDATHSQQDLNTFFVLMRQNINESVAKSTEFENKVKSQILAELHNLLKIIEKNKKEFSSISDDNSKELSKVKDSNYKVFEKLNNQINSFESVSPNEYKKSDYKKDPFLIKKQLLKYSTYQIKYENDLIDVLSNNEKLLKSFETKLILDLKKIFKDFNALVSEYHQTAINSNSALSTSLTQIPDGMEWSNFVTKNKDCLITSSIDEDANCSEKYKKTISNVTFKNSSHHLTIPVIEGFLSRKESSKIGINLIGNKNYSSNYCIISELGYFYEFESNNVLVNEPNLILFISDCEIKNISKDGMFRFYIKGKDASGMMMKPKKKYVFKASSDEDFKTWWNVLSKYCNDIESIAGGLSSSDAE